MIDKKELEWALERLEHVSIKLKLISIFLLTLSLFNTSVIILIFSIINRILYINVNVNVNATSIFLFLMMLVFVIIFITLWFDILRKDGKSYYDEISGALHGTSVEEVHEFKIDSLMARIVIRKFINSYDIPLMPGKYGPGILVLWNIMCLIFLVLMFRFNTPKQLLY